MSSTIVDQYCDAVEEWGQRTGRNITEVLEFSLYHSGGIWVIRRIGGVENSELPEHRNKPAGEIHGYHTVDQLRIYLYDLLDIVPMFPATLICGLVKSVETQLTHFALSFNKKVETNTEHAEHLLYMYEHPHEAEDLLAHMNENRKDGDKPFELEDLKRLADMFIGMIENVDDNEAERKLALTVWREVTAPILEYENLQNEILIENAIGDLEDVARKSRIFRSFLEENS